MTKQEYKEGYYQTDIACPKCGKHNVVSSEPGGDKRGVIWYDCNVCGYEGDGEKPYNSHVEGGFVKENDMNKLTDEIKIEAKEPIKFDNEKTIIKLNGYIITIEKEKQND